MKKIIIIVFLVLFGAGGIFAGFSAMSKSNDNNIESKTGTIISTNTGEIINQEDEVQKNEIQEEKTIKKDTTKEKVDALRKKLAVKGLALKGDINLEKGDYMSALVKYIQIHKEIPEDKSTIKKIGDIYFNLQKFKQAYSYYSTIKDYRELDKDRVVKTLLSFTAINDNNIPYLNNELDSLGLNEEQLFYYKNSISCVKDFSLCKQKFQTYFTEKIKQVKIIKGAGGVEKSTRFEELYNIESALINYENFQINDLLYKGALVSGAFYENGLYAVAIQTSKILLKQKNDYKPLLKLVAKSYYELGNYVEAKLYLIEYNKFVEEDSEASYFLGVVYEKLNEYLLSNIHFNKALKLGHKDILNINKRILFNYYELGEIEKMLETMKIIIEDYKNDLDVNDFNIAIYYHIVNDEIVDAKNFTELALKKFPESPILDGYMGWILMEEINKKVDGLIDKNNITILENKENVYSEAEKYINAGLEIDTNSPMLNLVKGKLEINKGDIKKAFIYFKKTVSIDKNGDFGEIARQELENIKIKK